MKFELNPYHRNISSEELLSDVRQVAVQLKKNTVSHSEYTQYGKYHPTTLIKRFGSWNKVLEKANLKIVLILNIPNEKFFKLTLFRDWLSQELYSKNQIFLLM